LVPNLNDPANTAHLDDWILGYCTNVHAGTDLATICDNLDRYAVPVRTSVAPEGDLGVGLWLPAQAARELGAGSRAAELADFLRKRHLCPFTINGFPFDNFHQEIVKHQVYLPTWWDSRRLEYTHQLAEILVQLLPADSMVGSISTLPIGWPDNPLDPQSSPPTSEASQRDLLQAGKYLRELADRLQGIEARTGRRIVVAIEPEPGCILDTTDDVIEWFHTQLPETHHRRYLTVCHDVCHAAVMMESQADVLSRLASAGIGIGKVQVSSAIVADWSAMAIGRRREAVEQLSTFADDRYLHQTGRLTEQGRFELSEDLPGLLTSLPMSGDPVQNDQCWVVHFHVPVFLERFGHLTTSHDAVLECLRALLRGSESSAPAIDFTGHLEVETYAWSVMPEAMRKRGLAEDIASEMVWLRKAIAQSL